MSARTPVLNQHWLLSGVTGSDEVFVWLERLGDTVPERKTKRTDVLVRLINGETRENLSSYFTPLRAF